jgi:DDE superfamily endonuclease
VLILTQDAGRLGRIKPPRRGWAPQPMRPVVPNQIVQEFLYVFAAVCPQWGRLTAWILPYANTAMMTLFLQHVAADFQDCLIVMLGDQAAWHTPPQRLVPETMRLLPLPPGSPELNPTAHRWADWRENAMAHQRFDSLECVEGAFCDGINRLAAPPADLRSRTNVPSLRLIL